MFPSETFQVFLTTHEGAIHLFESHYQDEANRVFDALIDLLPKLPEFIAKQMVKEVKESRASAFFGNGARYKTSDYNKLRETARQIADRAAYTQEHVEFSSLACELRAKLFNWGDSILSDAEFEFQRDFRLDTSWIRKLRVS